MFNINLISNPGIQKDSSDAYWSFLHKAQPNNNLEILENDNIKINQKWIYLRRYNWAYFMIMLLCIYIFYFNNSSTISSDGVLNQVVDLIIESGYVKEIQLSEAHFSSHNVQVTISSDKLNQIQEFSNGYRKEDNIPYKIYHKDNKNFITLDFPWYSSENNGEISKLKKLATKTVFSNKILINYSNNKFELQGRSSDIISYLLQMADDEVIQNYHFSVYHLDTGKFLLEILSHKI